MSTLPLAAVLGVLLGFIGVGFNRARLGSLDLAARVRHWPPFLVGPLAVRSSA